MKRTVFEFEDFRDSISFLYYKTCGRKALFGERFESGPSAFVRRVREWVAGRGGYFGRKRKVSC